MRRLRLLAVLAIAAPCVAYPLGDRDGACAPGRPEPPPEYRVPNFSEQQLLTMFRSPEDILGLLRNLKIVFDDNLLIQPALFEDKILRKLFNPSELQWVQPGTPDAYGHRWVRPQRIARIRFAKGSLAELKIDLGRGHKCLNSRANPRDPDVLISSHTYDAGYIYLRLEHGDSVTFRTVRQVFGPNVGSFGLQCGGPYHATYNPTKSAPNTDMFLLNSVDIHFELSAPESHAACEAGSDALPDEAVVRSLVIQLVERDHTEPSADVAQNRRDEGHGQ